MNKAEEQVVSSFIDDLEVILTDLKKQTTYLKLSPEMEKAKNEALRILEKKLNKLYKASSKDDLKKVIKLKKLLNKI